MTQRGAALAADPPQRADQPDVPDGVRELRPPRGLEIRQQVELAGVVGAVARTAAERHDAERVAAAAERPRDQVRRVDAVSRAADDAGPAGDGEPLAVGRRESTAFAAAASFGAGVCGRAAGRAGEAVCASSFLLVGSWCCARPRRRGNRSTGRLASRQTPRLPPNAPYARFQRPPVAPTAIAYRSSASRPRAVGSTSCTRRCAAWAVAVAGQVLARATYRDARLGGGDNTARGDSPGGAAAGEEDAGLADVAVREAERQLRLRRCRRGASGSGLKTRPFGAALDRTVPAASRVRDPFARTDRKSMNVRPAAMRRRSGSALLAALWRRARDVGMRGRRQNDGFAHGAARLTAGSDGHRRPNSSGEATGHKRGPSAPSSRNAPSQPRSASLAYSTASNAVIQPQRPGLVPHGRHRDLLAP